MDDQSSGDHDSLHNEAGSRYRCSSSQTGSEEGQHDADTRSQCSQRSDLGYHSAGASSDVGSSSHQHHPYDQGGYHPMSSMRSVGSSGSQENYHPSSLHHGRGVPFAGAGAAHLVSGEPQFPPSMYHSISDAPKSDAATVCSGSVVEDIEEESLLSCDLSSQQATGGGSAGGGGGGGSSSKPGSPPSSVKMAVGSLRRTNSAGNRLVDFADRSQELLASVIPQQRVIGHTSSDGVMSHHDDVGRLHEMGPPLSRTLLLQGGLASRAGSVKSFESNAGSDIVSHVDTDDLGGSLRESISDAHSVLSQEEAGLSTPAAVEDVKMAAAPKSSSMDMDTGNGGTDEDSEKPHPLLCSQSDPQNGRTSPGGTIYRGRGVRRYQGRFMHLPLQRFHQNGVHLRAVDEQQGAGGEGYDRYPHYDYDGDRWQDRYDDESWERGRPSSPRGSGRQATSNRQRTRSRSRSRSRSQEKGNGNNSNANNSNSNNNGEKEAYDNRRDSSSAYEDRGGGRGYRGGRGRNGHHQHNGHKNSNGYHQNNSSNNSSNKNHNGYKNGNYNNHNGDGPRHRGYRSRNGGGGGGRGGRYYLDEPPSSSSPPNNRNGVRNKNNRRK